MERCPFVAETLTAFSLKMAWILSWFVFSSRTALAHCWCGYLFSNVVFFSRSFSIIMKGSLESWRWCTIHHGKRLSFPGSSFSPSPLPSLLHCFSQPLLRAYLVCSCCPVFPPSLFVVCCFWLKTVALIFWCRAATVVATSEGILWALDRKTFKRIMCDTTSKKVHFFVKSLLIVVFYWLTTEQRATYQAFLEVVPMLKTLEVSFQTTLVTGKWTGSVRCVPVLQPYELMNLADALERKYYSDGECIITEVGCYFPSLPFSVHCAFISNIAGPGCRFVLHSWRWLRGDH